MEHDGEIELRGYGAERLEYWMVERHASRSIDHHPPGPAGFTPAVDLDARSFNVARVCQITPPRRFG
jgi:hypothetical protein